MALDTVNDLLEAIERLPPLERYRARVKVSAAMNRPAMEARALLGLIALDLADPYPADHAAPYDVIDLTAVSA